MNFFNLLAKKFHFLKYKEFFKLGARKFHFLKYKTFFRRECFSFFELGLKSALGDPITHYVFTDIVKRVACVRLTRNDRALYLAKTQVPEQCVNISMIHCYLAPEQIVNIAYKIRVLKTLQQRTIKQYKVRFLEHHL